MTLLLNPHEYDHDHDAGDHGHDDDHGHGHGHGYDDHVKPLTMSCKGFSFTQKCEAGRGPCTLIVLRNMEMTVAL